MNAATPASLATRANVKYVIDVSGLVEAEAILQAFPKAKDWNQSPDAICQGVANLWPRPSDRSMISCRQRNKPSAPRDRPSTSCRPTSPWLNSMPITAVWIARSISINRPTRPPALLCPLRHCGWRKRWASRTCTRPEWRTAPIARLVTSACSPYGRASRYGKTADAERAIKHFLSFLQQQPDNLEVRWLLNLAYMTIGRYPARGSARVSDSAGVLSSPPKTSGRFRDVAPQAGLDVVATAGGVIVDDFAGTGRFDVVTSNFDSCGPMHYFRNNGDGTFTERTSAAGLDGQLGGLNMIQTDYNNDGCKDILVLRGGWEVPQAQLTAAEQLRRHVHRCDRRKRTGGAGDEHANGGVGRHQQRWTARSLRRQRGSRLAVVPEQGRNGHSKTSRAAGVDRVGSPRA